MKFGRTLVQLLDCVMCRKGVESNDRGKLQIDVGRLREWAVENG